MNVIQTWEDYDYIEEADHLRHIQDNKSIYARREETIERVFADAKEKHGMLWTILRGPKTSPCRQCLLSLP